MTSSNTQLACHEEPELPPLPTTARQVPRFSRKRTIDEVLDNASSDLPQFSSDDASSTIENYAYQRPKRLRQGPWWTASQEKAASESRAHTRQNNLTRNFDSGVWMASDSSFGEEDVELITQEPPPALTTFPKYGTHKVFQIRNLPPLPHDGASPNLTENHRAAAKKVEQAVIRNNSSIDLTGMALETLPWSVLQPLTGFALEPKHRFESLDPRLEIFLAQNNLSEVPLQLWTLDGLSILSLRNNAITELPTTLAKLTSNLCFLNVSMNQLKYLPADIPDMMSPQAARPLSLQIAGNSFYKPILNTATNEVASDDELSIASARHVADSALDKLRETDPFEYMRRFIHGISPKRSLLISRIVYMDVTGQPINGPTPSRNQVALPISQDIKLRRIPKVVAGKVPSLYELALRASTVHPVKQLLLHLEVDAVPSSLIKNLQRAAEQSVSAYQPCSICKRQFSVPRTEWIEWQVLRGHNKIVPLLHRGCSWSCVPDTDHLPSTFENCGWYPDDTMPGMPEIEDGFGIGVVNSKLSLV